jgi:hypothetical protein
MVWAQHADGDAANAWLRQQIREIVADVGITRE